MVMVEFSHSQEEDKGNAESYRGTQIYPESLKDVVWLGVCYFVNRVRMWVLHTKKKKKSLKTYSSIEVLSYFLNKEKTLHDLKHHFEAIE